MNIVPTELNQRLANAVRYSVDSDRFYIGGKSGFWRLVGVGLIVFGLGASIGAACFGYSYVSDKTYNQKEFSSALSKALGDVQLKASAEGTVKLDTREITLAQGQAISLDASSRLMLDPTARVRADGEITVQGPIVSAAQGPNRPAAPIPNIANFTVFKGVVFDKGFVQTGWIFLTSAQKTPHQQYCYYAEGSSDTPGRNVSIDIGLDEKPLAPKTPQDFDLAAAFDHCVWFKHGYVQ